MRWAEEARKRYCTLQVACDGALVHKLLTGDTCGACLRKLKQREKLKQANAQALRGANTRG